MPFDEYQKGLISNFMRNSPWTKPMDSYQTQLSPPEEIKFRGWVGQNQQRLGAYTPDDFMTDYDYRGYWKANPKAAPDGHFPDTWKTPYHETFSNESMYAHPHAPQWTQDGKSWILRDKDGNIIKEESE